MPDQFDWETRVPIVVIIFGAVFIIVAFCYEGDYFSSDLVGSSISNVPLPKWFGRCFFFFMGVLFFVCGLALLYYGR